MGPTPKCHFVLGLPSGSLEIPQLGFSQLWGSITLHADLWLKWGLKKRCSPRRYLSNGMLHATWKWGNMGDSRLLVVGSQIVNLTLDLSFGHNLCLKCPNGSCKGLDIYVSRDFQWYKEIFNPLKFDPYNRSLKIWESTGIIIPKVEAPLGVWGFSGAWNVIPRLPSWPATLQALALVTSPRLGLWQQCHERQTM